MWANGSHADTQGGACTILNNANICIGASFLLVVMPLSRLPPPEGSRSTVTP
ncbi:hypothetical protein BIFBRE_03434 [Bifidobacterium breve DSM 20213 = JCM 1192]|uniref:Uncharacterized protein n=1 Tax=Bifidobacterium breve DSM 20213 = JCM 1192 TaxID=518634 RepID=D4BMY7_BIFBR|nr:hypothetical protein BIFBRE_03434 [Bifidobacterium breve DSM 20213 = JCM 1192]